MHSWCIYTYSLFILYTSGSTGKPKGVVHSTAGYLVNAVLTTQTTFDLQPNDVYCCVADCGWITGHTCMIVYTIEVLVLANYAYLRV